MATGLENVRSHDFASGIIRRILGFELSEEGGTQQRACENSEFLSLGLSRPLYFVREWLLLAEVG